MDENLSSGALVWPQPFQPQHDAVPFSRRPHVCAPPALIAVNLPGRTRIRPWPSEPQQAAAPLAVKPQLCPAPTLKLVRTFGGGGAFRTTVSGSGFSCSSCSCSFCVVAGCSCSSCSGFDGGRGTGSSTGGEEGAGVDGNTPARTSAAITIAVLKAAITMVFAARRSKRRARSALADRHPRSAGGERSSSPAPSTVAAPFPSPPSGGPPQNAPTLRHPPPSLSVRSCEPRAWPAICRGAVFRA